MFVKQRLELEVQEIDAWLNMLYQEKDEEEKHFD
jgi:hypothetical protein